MASGVRCSSLFVFAMAPMMCLEFPLSILHHTSIYIYLPEFIFSLFSFWRFMLGWHDLQLRTNIKELDLSEDDVDETDEQALARYEKEEMKMSFLSTTFANMINIY